MNATVTRDRRHFPDRRRAPTPLLAVLNPRGRRRSFRRDGEGEDEYVDRLAPRTVFLVVTIVCLSCLDALFTLLYLQKGGTEANPFMELALFEGVAVFLLVKGVLTVLGVLFLAVHQNFRIGGKALRLIALGYVALTLYHVGLHLHVF